MKKRLREFDFLRAIAAISIIAIHVTARFAFNSRGAYFWNQAMRYAVPMFIIISGLLLLYTDMDSKKLNYFGFLYKRLKKILIPYILWTVAYIIYNQRHDLIGIWAAKQDFLADLCRCLLFGTGGAHLYFIAIIIQLYLLYPLLRMLVTKWPRIILSASLITTFVFQTAVYLWEIKLLTLAEFVIPYYIFFPTWVFYFVLGMYVSLNMKAWQDKLAGRGIHVIIVWVLSLGILLVDSKLTLTYGSSIKPSIMLYSITSFMFLYSVSAKFSDTLSLAGKILDWLSLQSFNIYFCHVIIINLIIYAFNFSGFVILSKGIIGALLLFETTLLLSSLFAYVAGLTPLAVLAGGVYTRRKQHLKDAGRGTDMGNGLSI